MTPQVIIKGADWTLSRETAEGAPEGIYGAQCLTCGQQSGLIDNETRPIEVWAIMHTRQDPTHTHRQFRFGTECFWRVDPTPAAVTPEPHGVGCPAAPPHQHSRRGLTRLRRTLTYTGRFAGPIFIATIAGGCGLVIGILLATA